MDMFIPCKLFRYPYTQVGMIFCFLWYCISGSIIKTFLHESHHETFVGVKVHLSVAFTFTLFM